MSVIARLEVIPTGERSMSDSVARAVSALDGFDVSYEVTPTDTVIEADDAAEVFAAASAAHAAVRDERVVTTLEVDDQPGRPQRRWDRVASVERELGRPARRDGPETGQSTADASGAASSQSRGRSPARSSRYLGTEPAAPR